MRLVYSPRYHIDIGTHVFPTVKYALLHRQLDDAGGYEFSEPSAVSWDELALVHTDEYLHKVRSGDLTMAEIAELELPWTPEVVDGFRLMTGGTILAARQALHPESRGVGANLGGGFHHAFSNHGEGFCLFNDVAIAIRLLQQEGRIARAAIVDCDVHHGNGTAMIFDRDPAVFTMSIHQQCNYPAFKPRSSLDIGVADRLPDAEYLARLQGALPRVMEFGPDIVFYLAGADPFQDDQLGGLALTKSGLSARDRLVLETCVDAEVPVAITLAGGYARKVEDTVAIHRATIEQARAILRTISNQQKPCDGL
jgi:acetoin utilization deacetylase AcuC-like enzyme